MSYIPKLGLFNPPQLRAGRESEKERHSTWLELFHDLVFVAAVGQLATTLGNDYSWTGMLRFCLVFVPLCNQTSNLLIGVEF